MFLIWMLIAFGLIAGFGAFVDASSNSTPKRIPQKKVEDDKVIEHDDNA